MTSPLKALNDHLRDENAERVERLRQKERGVCVAPAAPTHEEIVADFQARQAQKPAFPRHVEGARYRVRFRYIFDRMRQVRHFTTEDDRVAFIAALDGSAEIIEVFEC